MTFPEIEYCIVCDGVRPELGNKLNILGFFGVTPSVEVTISGWGKHTNLTFLVGTRATTGGTYILTQAIINPDGTTLFSMQTDEIQLENTQRAVLGFGFRLVFNQQGQHEFRLMSGSDLIYSTSFAIVRDD